MPEVEASQEPWVEVLKALPPEQVGKFNGYFLGMVQAAIKSAMPGAINNALEKHGYTEEIADLIRVISARTNDPKEEVLRKALTLYEVCLDARDQGNRVSILSPDDLILSEVKGFEPAEREVAKAAH
jgi:hypothetical protein